MSKIDLETFDLAQLPSAEDDDFEFKSSSTTHNDLKKKLSCAVSGFANSGGGYFVAGVDGNGEADGGLPLKIGRQDIRDWADQVVNQVEPVPRYDIKLIYDPMGRGTVHPDSAVLLVGIHESYIGPHMAPDNHYYIRAGAHTVKAKHFIIDAIWAKRHFSKPRLTHLFRLKPEDHQAVQLGLVTLTDAPAIDVSISISPLPQLMQNSGELFPLKVTIIDRNHPFFLDVMLASQLEDKFGKDVSLRVEYYDLALNVYTYAKVVDIAGSLPPITISKTDERKNILLALKSIDKTLSKVVQRQTAITKPTIFPTKNTKNVFSIIEKLIPELLLEMKNDLNEYPFAREFVILSKDWTYNGNPNNMVLKYYFEEYVYLRNKLRILENYALIYEITYDNTVHFVILENLANYLINSQSE